MDIKQVSALPAILAPVVGVDIETNYDKKAPEDSANPHNDRMLSIAVSDGETTWVLKDNFMSIASLLVNPDIKKVGQGLAFDLKYFLHMGIETNNIHDTLMAERTLWLGYRQDQASHGLDAILSRRLGVYIDKAIRESFSDHRGAFTQEQLEYMARDVMYLPKLYELQMQDIGRQGLGRVMALENELVPITAEMILNGIGFDRALWDESVGWIEKRKEEIKLRLVDYLNIPYTPSLFGGIEMGINLNSPTQLLDYLEPLGYEFDSTKEVYLQMALEDAEPDSMLAKLLQDVMEWREWEKMLDYDYPKHVNRVTGNIHATWNQIGTVTGRYSCKKPNVQNTKRPVPEQPNFRALFPPRPGYKYIVADYAQQEPRILAELSQDPHLIEAALSDDIYSPLASRVYGKQVAKKDVERARMKVALLADFYGAGPAKLAYVLHITENEAKEMQDKFRATFPKAYAWGDAQLNNVVQRGYVTTATGRRRFFPDAKGMEWLTLRKRYSREARNTPIQGTGADSSKLAMLLFSRWKKSAGETDRIVVTMHDELVVETREEDAEMMLYQVVGSMESAMQKICPNIKPLVEGAIMDRWGKL